MSFVEIAAYWFGLKKKSFQYSKKFFFEIIHLTTRNLNRFCSILHR